MIYAQWTSKLSSSRHRILARGAVAGALVAIAGGAWPSTAAAAPVTILDVTDVHAYTSGAPSNCCGFVSGWGDAVQGASHPYNTDRIVFDRIDATHATIQIFTQFNGYQSIGGGKAVHYADLFIDTGTPSAPGGVTYGISLGFQGGADGNGGLSTPGLYQITNPATQVKTSQDIWNGRSGWIFGGEYALQDDHANAHLVPTVLTGGTNQNWTVSVSETDPLGNVYTPGPNAPVATSGLYALTVSLEAPSVSAMDLVLSNFDLLWGTGDCANDVIWGSDPPQVPEPPTLLALLGGLALLRLRRARRRG